MDTASFVALRALDPTRVAALGTRLDDARYAAKDEDELASIEIRADALAAGLIADLEEACRRAARRHNEPLCALLGSGWIDRLAADWAPAAEELSHILDAGPHAGTSERLSGSCVALAEAFRPRRITELVASGDLAERANSSWSEARFLVERGLAVHDPAILEGPLGLSLAALADDAPIPARLAVRRLYWLDATIAELWAAAREDRPETLSLWASTLDAALADGRVSLDPTELAVAAAIVIVVESRSAAEVRAATLDLAGD